MAKVTRAALRAGADEITPDRSRNTALHPLCRWPEAACNPLGDGHLRSSALSFVGEDHPDRGSSSLRALRCPGKGPPFRWFYFSDGVRDAEARSDVRILLICAGWVPPDWHSSRSCLTLGTKIALRRFLTATRVLPRRPRRPALGLRRFPVSRSLFRPLVTTAVGASPPW